MGFAPPASAFHSGGVAECEGCHTMHNSLEGKQITTAFPQFQSGPYLLKGTDQSSTCLTCHENPDGPGNTAGAQSDIWISTSGVAKGVKAPAQFTQGGDFAWLKIDYSGARGGAAAERHGHNIIASDFGYVPDGTLTVAPGGTYPASALGCQSCHDPHGKARRDANGNWVNTGLPTSGSGSYANSAVPIANVSAVGAFRILGGKGYQPKSLSGAFAFNVNPPDAVGGPTQDEFGWNRSEANGDTNVTYGRGMSEFCANCHPAMLESNYTSGMKGLVHPAGNGGKLTAPIAANYNAYVTSGRLTGVAPNYSTLVPFEQGVTDSTPATYLALANSIGGNAQTNYTPNQVAPKNTITATTQGNVMCLSCHRAHATAFGSSIRYFLENQFMTKNATDGTNVTFNGPGSQAEMQAAYLGRAASQFGPWARAQCNKCHAKD